MASRFVNIVSSGSIAAGATVQVPHYLNRNDLPLVPDIYSPQPGWGVTVDAINVTFTNNTGAQGSGKCYVRWDHSIQRVFGAEATQTLPDYPYEIAGGSNVVLPPAVCTETTRYEQYVTDVRSPLWSGLLEPDPALNVVHVYIRSNWTQEGSMGGFEYIPGPNPGDDSNDGLTPLTPIETFEALYCKFATKASGHALYIVHLADASSPNNGFDGGIDCPPLYYQVEEVRVGGGAGNACSYVYMGPPRPRIWHPLGVLQSQAVSGVFPYGESVLTFLPGHGIDGWSGVVGYMVCVQANGDYFVPPMPLLRHTDTDFYLPDGGTTAAIGAPLDGTYYVGRAGAVVVCWRDYDPLITGQGCYRAGLQEKTIIPDPDAQNPRPTFLGIEFAGATIEADNVSFDRCSFLDHSVKATGRRPEFKECRFVGLWLHDASGRVFGWRNNTTGNVTNREFGSYQLDEFGIVTTNKYVGCDMIVTQVDALTPGRGIHIGGGQEADGIAIIQPGAEDGFATGELLIYRGLYGYGLNRPLINLYGTAQFASCEDANVHTHNVPVVIFLVGKSEARVWSPGIIISGTNTTTFRIGYGTTGDPQVDTPLADFVNAALWNLNLCIFRPHVPANAFGAGIPPATIFPYGCMARVYQGT